MTSGIRACLLLALVGVGGIFAASEACSEDPVNTMVGEIGQPCFPGDTCVAPYVCYPLVFDGGGTDGGQCGPPVTQPDAGDAGGDAADVLTDVVDAKIDVHDAASDVPDVGAEAPDAAPDATDARADGD